MLYPYAFYTAVMIVTGSALLLVWHKDRAQRFAALLGLAHLVFCFNPLAYWAWRQPEPVWAALGFVGLVSVAAGSITLLIGGFAHLSRQNWPPRTAPALFFGQAAFYALLLSIDTQLAQAGVALMNTAAGLIVCRWLWPLGQGERITGVVLVLLGLNFLPFVIWGDPAAPVQTAVAAVLRVVLCLALIYAAMVRSAARANRLKDRFFELTERSHQGVAVVRRGHVAYANPAFRRIFGMDRVSDAPEVFSREWVRRTVPDAERDHAESMALAVVRGQRPQAEWEGERLSLDGRRLDLRFKAWPVDWDGQAALQVVVSDETAHRDAARALQWRSQHDELTGLPNRHALLQRLQASFDDAGRRAFVLLLMDVDRFKFFNEAHGHQVGDEVLVALAQRLQQALHERAELMRLGEDEFALLASADDAARMATELAHAVRGLLTEPLQVGEHRFYLDVSMGVATHPSSAPGPQELLQAAHAAMHEAKRLPGTSVQFAAEQIKEGMAAFFNAEQALRAGLQNHEFTLVYQPKVAAQGGQLIGFEALVRWDRPGLGRVNPLDFIPAAERTGLIVPLGAQILDQACEQLAAWRDAGLHLVPVAVNVSPLQLLDEAFPAQVIETLRRHGLAHATLTLEITESAAVMHMDQANAHIQQLREQGVEVALDDFGTGFSSLNMLRSLPLHTVKIDRSLIDPMPASDAVAVVKAICDLAAVLRLDVVAEGVETAAHAQAARDAGCHALQGYLYARPLSAEEATTWLQPALKPAT
ncbi:MAG: GGDEF domain-containing protein [Burkholderiales bacterium]|nr:GGDEF domain-containing protein [Burkholderiales bacterium]MBH2016757.1 GGDEF domain-containing protein [Burkholderiales bacterium]